MRKAFVCARLSTRLYARSGRVVFPLLPLIAYPLIFYQIIPVDTASSFAMSAVAAFLWGTWLALAAVWAEDKTLREILIVKSGRRYFPAQQILLMLFGAAGGAFLVLTPLLAHWAYLPDMFTQAPTPTEVALGLALNACAGLCGGAFGAVFHPRLIRDRKAAYPLCLLLGLLGLVGGVAGIPFALRLLLPPLYDTIEGLSGLSALTAGAARIGVIRYLLYAAACVILQSMILSKTEE